MVCAKFFFLVLYAHTYPGKSFNLAMIASVNMMRWRAFVTCNRGKTLDTIVGSEIPGNTGGQRAFEALLSHSLRPLRRDESPSEAGLRVFALKEEAEGH